MLNSRQLCMNIGSGVFGNGRSFVPTVVINVLPHGLKHNLKGRDAGL